MASREIVLDTETTGLNALGGDRIVEIGCVEMVNHVPTGAHLPPLHQSRARSSRGASPCTACPTSSSPTSHSLPRSPRSFWPSSATRRWSRTTPTSTSAFSTPNWAGWATHRSTRAHRRYAGAGAPQAPAGPNSLDALCQRYGIDNSERTKHGALLDAEIAGRRLCRAARGTAGDPRPWRRPQGDGRRGRGARSSSAGAFARPVPLPPRLTEAELAAHGAFVATLGAQRIWLKYVRETEAKAAPRDPGKKGARA